MPNLPRRPPLHLERLPFPGDAAELFGAIAAEPWAMLLDSNAGSSAGGRWDILVAAPRVTLRTVRDLTEIRSGNGVWHSTEDPLALLRRHLDPGATGDDRAADAGLPFIGGAVGWFGYDLARRFERLGPMSELRAGESQMAVGLYDWVLLVDHQTRVAYVVGCGDPSDPRRRRLVGLAQGLVKGSARVAQGGFRVLGDLVGDMDAQGYRRRFDAVQRYIRNGDCYQVNLSRGWSVPVAGEPWQAYRRLRAINPAPFAAYLNTPGTQVLSASPERFLEVRGGRVETRPIKGTAPRHADAGQDHALAEALAASDKDRAENLMIVDLLRNDLGRCCQTGSVRVPELFRVESYPGVHHLVSSVTGRLRDDADALGLLRACFPGGSITGAPKIRTMQIIDELEGRPRGVYCGAIGYIGRDGAMDSNIAIRTASIAGGRFDFRAGGGLVADSDPDAEWDEIGIKSRAMMELVADFRG